MEAHSDIEIKDLFPLDTGDLLETPLIWRNECLDVHGDVFFNGPAKFGNGAFRYKHWLDGDGYLQKIRLCERPTICGKFVKTKKRTEELAAGRPIYRAFGTAFYGDKVSQFTAIENPINVNVSPWGNDLLAWGEGSQPYLIDSSSLETIGSWGIEQNIGPFERMSGHPKMCPFNGSLIIFSLVYQDQGAFIEFSEFPRNSISTDQGGAKLDSFRVPLEQSFSVHDFALTQGFVLMVLHPYFTERELVMKKNKSILDSLRWFENLPTQMLVVPRLNPNSYYFVDIPSKYVIHWMNCRESGDELICDLIEYMRPLYNQYTPLASPYNNLSQGRCQRIIVNVEKKRVVQEISRLTTSYPDFPAIQHAVGQQKLTERFWCLGIAGYRGGQGNFFNQVVSGSFISDETECWLAPKGVFVCSEPLLIPTKGGSEMLLAVQFSDLVKKERGMHFFSPSSISHGPLGSLIFPCALPFPLHGFWREPNRPGVIQ